MSYMCLPSEMGHSPINGNVHGGSGYDTPMTHLCSLPEWSTGQACPVLCQNYGPSPVAMEVLPRTNSGNFFFSVFGVVCTLPGIAMNFATSPFHIYIYIYIC